MKLKCAVLMVLVLAMIAVSAPTVNYGDGAIAKNLVCQICNSACDQIAQKCYDNAVTGGKLYEMCSKIDEGCHAKCPCE